MSIPSIRVIFLSTEGNNWRTKTREEEILCLTLSSSQAERWKDADSLLQEGINLNLLNVKLEEDSYEAEFIIFEPDYLLDVSSLAECYRPFGNHPLNYFLARIQQRTNSVPILLGNTANYFVDLLVNEEEANPLEYKEVLQKLFKEYAFEFSSCADLKDSTIERTFFSNAAKHYENIRNVIQQSFHKAGMQRDELVLEPAFICNLLGLQGRLDISQMDGKVFVELKSGKAFEDFRTGQFIHSAKNHYTQMILYLAMLEFNLQLDPDTINSYLFYSRYPVLSKEHHSRPYLEEVLDLRNQIVLKEYYIQNQNNTDYTEAFLSQISPDTLNIAGLSGKFFDNYLSPPIINLNKAYQKLSRVEQLYFLRQYNFITKELWLSKAGEKDYEGSKQASVMWNAPFETKIKTGEILYDLQISDNKADLEASIKLSIPNYPNFYLPNFREGDAIVLYERNKEEDTINNKQVFKGSIEKLSEKEVLIRLRFLQKNKKVWNESGLYAIEHDYMDSVTTNLFKGLNTFMHANKKRRELILGARLPESNYEDTNEKDSLTRSVCKALNNKDLFLLVGPPGTGKTSMALKRIIEGSFEKNEKNILLLSYTNRAVDEICNSLLEMGEEFPFVRIGHELNCAPEYRPFLLKNQLEPCVSRKEVETKIKSCPIIVGTVASVWSKQDLFNLKQFDLAIIDEASQILEAHLLGILSLKMEKEENVIKRFVLIGDHKQLPAIVLQSKNESRINESELQELNILNLKDSFFERLYRHYKKNNLDTAFDMLDKQGRMHPDIAEFPSRHFYHNQLLSVGLPHQKENIEEQRLSFCHISPFSEEKNDKSNQAEAEKIIKICLKLYNESKEKGEIFIPERVGIITPFRNQIAMIRKKLHETNIAELAEIMVDTVERYQGSQRDIIIYSFCIKTQNQLNALPNWIEEDGKQIDRKLNVAITRARKKMYLIGNQDLLSKNSLYKELISVSSDFFV